MLDPPLRIRLAHAHTHGRGWNATEKKTGTAGVGATAGEFGGLHPLERGPRQCNLSPGAPDTAAPNGGLAPGEP